MKLPDIVKVFTSESDARKYASTVKLAGNESVQVIKRDTNFYYLKVTKALTATKNPNGSHERLIMV